ncbi:hypothetical protein ACJX0J_012194 [Zea mays]
MQTGFSKFTGNEGIYWKLTQEDSSQTGFGKLSKYKGTAYEKHVNVHNLVTNSMHKPNRHMKTINLYMFLEVETHVQSSTLHIRMNITGKMDEQEIGQAGVLSLVLHAIDGITENQENTESV